MRFVIQRVQEAGVSIEGKQEARIEKGLLVLIGVCDADTTQTADKMTRKLLGLRIFEDTAGKTNLSIQDVNGQILLVPQFTLYADCRKGNRPSFQKAGDPAGANRLFEYHTDASPYSQISFRFIITWIKKRWKGRFLALTIR